MSSPRFEDDDDLAHGYRRDKFRRERDEDDYSRGRSRSPIRKRYSDDYGRNNRNYRRYRGSSPGKRRSPSPRTYSPDRDRKRDFSPDDRSRDYSPDNKKSPPYKRRKGDWEDRSPVRRRRSPDIDDSPSRRRSLDSEEKNEERAREEAAKGFFEKHKKDAWFRERFHPQVLEEKYNERIALAQKNAKQFADDVNNGSLQVNLDASIDEFGNISEANPSTQPEQPPGSVLFIKNVPPTLSRSSLMEIFSTSPGYRKLTLSEPNKFKGYTRLGWVIFDTAESCSAALAQHNNKQIGTDTLQLQINKTTEPIKKTTRLTPPVASEESRIAIDLEQSKQLMEQLDKEKKIEENVLLQLSENELSNSEQLDRVIVYLRRVHFYCYYCGEEYEEEDDMLRKCGNHLRGKKSGDSQIDATSDTWASSLDTKIKHRIQNPENPDTYTGKQLHEQLLNEWYETNSGKIEEEKYRCCICNKLFMADKFVRKHLLNRHIEQANSLKEKSINQQYWLNYWNDPKKTYIPSLQPKIPNKPMDQFKGGWSSQSPVGYGRGRGKPGYSPGYGMDVSSGKKAKWNPLGSDLSEKQIEPDPRPLRAYVDLDAPPSDNPTINYRQALEALKKKKAAKKDVEMKDSSSNEQDTSKNGNENTME